VLLLLLAPFSMDVVRFFNQMTGTAGGYPWLSVNAYNIWALIGTGGAGPLAFGGGWSSDTVGLLGPLPGVLIGGILLALGFAVGILRLAWQDDRRSIVIVATFLALAFFMLPTRVHERYMFPIFGLLPLLAVVDRRWMLATIALSIAAFINLHGVLTIGLYATPNLEHLPFGELFRQPLGVLTAIFLNVFGFVLVASQLRPSAAARQKTTAAPWSTSPTTFGDGQTAPVAATSAAAAIVPPEVAEDEEPVESSVWQRWLSFVVNRPSVRRDRSALLINERGGKLDRRDLALVLLVFIASLFLRTYRLEVPYGPHFDEVYHARTAVEFLQDWRYDMPHSIYEFTHPHLAKYAMAWGITLLGNNRVIDTLDLGTPVRDAATETRWSPPDQPNSRNGDRLYVATGSELRVYDLATKEQVATLPGPFVTLAIDQASHTLYLADAAGSISTLPTDQLDAARRSRLGPQLPTAYPLTQATELVGSVSRLHSTGSGLLAVSDGGSVVSFDATGSRTGRAQLSGVASVVSVPPRAEVLADPAQITDRTGYAQTLADLISGDAILIEDALSAANGQRVMVAGEIGAVLDDVQAAIDDGRLPGTVVEPRPLVAIGTSNGIELRDAASLAEIDVFATDQPVGGMALVARGPDVPTIYAASGAQLITLRLPSDSAAVLGSPLTMPNTVEDVRWNQATTNIHVLGRAQHAATPTVYVVEPRSNAIFADAPLAFEPRTLTMDVQPERPAEDRDDLLALSDTGQLATIDVGNNGWAYRFPGVLVAALMAACIYLLARFLSARRAVALIVALLVLADGMFFANARIAMNDTYVAFFIVAAMTLFVPLWLGRWRSRGALVAGLLGVGVLLGLAFASKWVGLYAIGAVALLVLIRSALGRWIALLAMIALTAILGYIAISPATTVANPSLNYLFLFVMVGLTVLLALAMAIRPMRFSPDELRLGALAALVPGPLILAYGVYKSAQGGLPLLGTFFTPARLIQLGLALTAVGVVVVFGLWFAGKRGYGPLARRIVANDETPAEPPAPRGWLRPGSGFLGLPWLLALGALLIVPIGVYIISYIPWINLGNHWGLPFFPAGTDGQAFLDLQKSMYDYHNNLRATHPASSPWWAWLLDLKPVWFEQSNYANSTTAVIYDTGNLVAFWLAIPAIGWACWQAWKRHSLPLTFIAVAIACLWLPWARIDRATFQYHIFTTLPFTFLALAYFLAELWHGPARGTWAVARVGAAIAVIGAPLLWLLRQPLCGLANTQSVNPNTEVCSVLSRALVLTDIQAIGVALAVGGLIAAGLSLAVSDRETGYRPLLIPFSFAAALIGAMTVLLGSNGKPFFQITVQAEFPALAALLLLAVPAYFVLRASDPRKFVVGALTAAVIWFVAFYPNIASLPVPTPLSQVHLGLLPTWNWGFQFGVNRDPAANVAISWPSVSLLAVAVVGLCILAVYAARTWSSARYSDDEVGELPEAI
jgi:predicted membrane-bound dolichyl-phosphate-mannose-protein mannosyltransferase